MDESHTMLCMLKTQDPNENVDSAIRALSRTPVLGFLPETNILIVGWQCIGD